MLIIRTNKLIKAVVIAFALVACDTDNEIDVSESQPTDEATNLGLAPDQETEKASLESELETELRDARDCNLRCCDGALFHRGPMGMEACRDQRDVCAGHGLVKRIRWGGQIIFERYC